MPELGIKTYQAKPNLLFLNPGFKRPHKIAKILKVISVSFSLKLAISLDFSRDLEKWANLISQTKS